MSGRPAARLGDPTAHGGTLVGPGVATVLIGKMPAATAGDQHACPMATPGTPPIPHVGGPVVAGSTGVLLGKKPAARQGDPAVCVGPPSSIAMGCATVLIGEVGASSPGGLAAAAALATGRPTSLPASAKAMDLSVPETSPNQAWEVVACLRDKGGRALAGIPYRLDGPGGERILGASGPDGRVGHGVYPCQGSYGLSVRSLGEVRWSTSRVEVGRECELSCRTDAEEGASGAFFVSLVGPGADRVFLDRVEGRVAQGALRARWALAGGRRELKPRPGDEAPRGLEAVAALEGCIAVSRTIAWEGKSAEDGREGSSPNGSGAR